MPLQPSPTREGPAGHKSSLQTEKTTPNADFLLICNSLPTLNSTRKNKLTAWRKKKILPVSWTISYNHMLISGKAVNFSHVFFKKCSDTVLPAMGGQGEEERKSESRAAKR